MNEQQKMHQRTLRVSSSSCNFRQNDKDAGIHQLKDSGNIPSMNLSVKSLAQKQQIQMRGNNFEGDPRLLRTSRDHLHNENMERIKNAYFGKNSKENACPNKMIASVPSQPTKIRKYQQKNTQFNNEYNPFSKIQNEKKKIQPGNNFIKIQSYEGKRFKTHEGYTPMMTKSRYETQPESNGQFEQGQVQDIKVYGTHSNLVFREGHRPITFGVIKRDENAVQGEQKKKLLKSASQKSTAANLKYSLQHYEDDKKIKNQVLQSIQIRRSQEKQLRKSCQQNRGQKVIEKRTKMIKSISGGSTRDNFHLNCNRNLANRNIISGKNTQEEDLNQFTCENHAAKKAKYKLIIMGSQEAIGNSKAEKQELMYCSKCAINLLQQGFKVQELIQNGKAQISTSTSTTKQLLKNHQHTLSATNIFASPSHKSTQFMQSSTGSNISRIQQVKNFQIQIKRSQQRFQTKLATIESNMQRVNILGQQTKKVYSYLIECLTEMKTKNEENMMEQIQNLRRQHEEGEMAMKEVNELGRQIKQHRNKYIVMKDKNFKMSFEDFMQKYHEEEVEEVEDTKEGQLSQNSSQIEIQQKQAHYRSYEYNINSLNKEYQEKVEQIMRTLSIRCEELFKFFPIACKNKNKVEKKEFLLISQEQEEIEQPHKKKPFRTLFSDEDSTSAFYRKRTEDNCINVDLYHNNENQSPSFQKNDRISSLNGLRNNK